MKTPSLRPLPLLAICVLVAASPAWAQSDNFNDGNDDGWLRYDPIRTATSVPQNTWSFPGGAYRLQAVASPNLATLGPARVGSLRGDIVHTSFFVFADVVGWNDSFLQAITVAARIQPNPGPATTSGYAFGFVPSVADYAQIVRITGERTFTIPGSPQTNLVLNPTNRYRITFGGTGGQLTGAIYQHPDLGTPLVTVTATDTTYASGSPGLIAFSLNTAPQPVDVIYDNFSALDHEPPRLLVEDLHFGDLRLSWPASAPGYTLQCTASLPAATWTDVTEIILIDGRIFHFTSSAEGTKFFRLRRP